MVFAEKYTNDKGPQDPVLDEPLQIRGIEWIFDKAFKLYFKEGVSSKWYGNREFGQNEVINQFEFSNDSVIS